VKFRKRFTPIPGFRINLSRSGASATLGVPGLSVNIGRKGAYLNTGIPGTGIYDRKKIGGKSSGSSSRTTGVSATGTSVPTRTGAIESIGSADAEQLHHSSFDELRESIREVYHRRQELFAAIAACRKSLKKRKEGRGFLRIILIGFLMPFLTRRIREKQTELNELQAELEGTVLEVECGFTDEVVEVYKQLTEVFNLLAASRMISDITGHGLNPSGHRKQPETILKKSPVSFNVKQIPMLRTHAPAMHLENANGHDIYLYPGFVILTDNWRELVIAKPGDLHFTCTEHFTNSYGNVPADAEVVGHEWAYANKDGSPDRRHKANFQVPRVRLAQLEITSADGLKEVYLISNYAVAELFARLWKLWHHG